MYAYKKNLHQNYETGNGTIVADVSAACSACLVSNCPECPIDDCITCVACILVCAFDNDALGNETMVAGQGNETTLDDEEGNETIRVDDTGNGI